MGGHKYSLRPWIIGALAWECLSLAVIGAYLGQGDTEQLNQIWFLMTLLWLEFGFAGTFHALKRRGPRALPHLLPVILLPPLLLHFIIFLIA